MKLRLIAGTINDWPDDGEWMNFTIDASPRGIWNRDLEMTVAPSFVGDVRNLVEFRDETFDEVRLHHVLEHIPIFDDASQLRGARGALEEIARVLKRGGVLDVEVPAVDRIIAAYVEGDLDLPGLSQWLLGEQLPNHELYDCHRSIWTEDRLRRALAGAGFDVPDDEVSTGGYAIRLRAINRGEES